MRSIYRLLMAGILVAATAGVVRAQEANAAPPPVATPAPALPPIPFAQSVEPAAPSVEPALPANESGTPAVEPAVSVEPSAPIVEPAALGAVNPPAPETLQVTTTVKRVTRKNTKKPAEKPVAQVSEPSRTTAAAASAATVDTTASTPPPDAAAKTAPLEAIAPAPPAAKVVAVESRSEEAIPEKKLSTGSWILFTLALIALAGMAIKFLRRRLRSPTSIVDFTTISPEPKPSLVTRP